VSNRTSDWCEQLTEEGYTLLPAVLSTEEVESVRRSCAGALTDPGAASSLLTSGEGPPYGARNLLRLWPEVVDLIRNPSLSDPLTRILGDRCGLVRGLYFDKPPGNSWALPWHRDSAVAVKSHGIIGRFARPTVKAGVPHVDAPADLLATMLTVRVHLDDMSEANGPLLVVPGSHRETPAPRSGDPAGIALHCAAGDALLMRPLLLHASAHCTPGHGGHRRIVHLELAPAPELPDGYEWHTFLPLRQGTAVG
jgi:hypothetical protein